MVKQFREAQDVEEVISPTRLQTVDHQRPDGNALVEASFDGHRVMDAAVEPGRGRLLRRLPEGAELARAPLGDGVLIGEREITEEVCEHVRRSRRGDRMP